MIKEGNERSANLAPLQPISIEDEVRLGRLAYHNPDYKQTIDSWLRIPPAQS
ncbi:MAG: hypothetical protein Q7K03_06290 [Dehalococcoidia bacterium]|nr:hypothetical protein [Dehalococcoidia bacterium]